MLNEVIQTETNIGYCLHMELKKNDTNALIYKTETDSQTKKINLRYQRGTWGRDKLGGWY